MYLDIRTYLTYWNNQFRYQLLRLKIYYKYSYILTNNFIYQIMDLQILPICSQILSSEGNFIIVIDIETCKVCGA